MKIKTDFPRPVREVSNAWITLSDGCQLSARIWLPRDAEESPVPAILEYLPYRKNDGTVHRDAAHHPYFAGHGYACVRVDMRGSGDSDGILMDEYLPQEQDDALEILSWLAEQPWCTGDVGMIGISWGGFNGLQVAACQPEQLKAVITICSTDDRYADDVHYMGGCLLADQMLPWASTMLAYNARPPDPKVVGDRWREKWLRRMEETPPFIEAWLSHQRRDGYWKHGSVCEDFSSVRCPVYAVGGWADPYSNAVLRLFEGLPGPRKGLIGPWAHLYPEQGIPGPSIGFLQECLRWWDHWLKGEETCIMDEPMLRIWMQDSVPPRSTYPERPGRWVSESSWPSSNVESRSLFLSKSGLEREPSSEVPLDLKGRQTTGLYSGRWLPFGKGPDFPPDQRAEEGGALTFTSQSLSETMEILGFPEVVLDLCVDCPNALVAVWLSDVAPGGESTLVTRGLLNLTHRDGHEEPVPLRPGERYTAAVRLNAIAHAFPEGHRVRISISPTYWPWAWPSPEPVTLNVFSGRESRVELPVRNGHSEDAELRPFEPSEVSPPLDAESFGGTTNTVLRVDRGSGRAELVFEDSKGGFRLLSDGFEYQPVERDVFTITEGDPLSATVRCERTVEIARNGWQTRVEASSKMSSDNKSFTVTNLLEGFEGNVRVFSKAWSIAIPRDFV
jgi:putative CocE/NonD family hydrolase